MSDKKILSIIPEELHSRLFEEVAQTLAERGKTKLEEVSPEIKAYIAKQQTMKEPSDKEIDDLVNRIM